MKRTVVLVTCRKVIFVVVAGIAVAAVAVAGYINRHSWDWGDFPTWILAAGAIVTAVFAYLAFRKQSQEVGLLQVQADRDVERRRRAQASGVFIWQKRLSDASLGQAQIAAGAVPDRDRIHVYVKNTSDQPVYDAQFRWYLGSPEDGVVSTDPLPILLPGDDAERSRPIPGDEEPRVLSATLWFRDASQLSWNRYMDGQLFED